MGKPATEPEPAFHRSVVQKDGRLIILSTCAHCGKERLVSRIDGSLEAWEDGHSCGEGPSLRVVNGE